MERDITMTKASDTVTMQRTKAPRRRFSLKWLFVIHLVVALACSFVAVRLHRGYQQRRAVEQVVECGGSVFYDYQRFPAKPSGWCILEDAKPSTPAWIRNLFGRDVLHRVVTVDCGGAAGFGDEEARALGNLTALDSVVLDGTGISDMGMVALSELANLEDVSLQHTEISDEGIAALEQSVRLKYLTVSYTRVTDVGARRLSRIRSIHYLNLEGCPVGDAACDYLASMPNLGVLSLDSTRVTDAGLMALARAPKLYWVSVVNAGVTQKDVRQLNAIAPGIYVRFREEPHLEDPFEGLLAPD